MKSQEKHLSSYQSLLGVAYAFAIVSTILTAPFLITLCWKIPMTKNINRRRLAAEPIECLSLGIWSIFFLSLIGGILLIIANGKVSQFERAKISDATNARTSKVKDTVVEKSEVKDNEIENNIVENNETDNTNTSLQV